MQDEIVEEKEWQTLKLMAESQMAENKVGEMKGVGTRKRLDGRRPSKSLIM